MAFGDSLDRAILSVFPGWGTRRIEARRRFASKEKWQARLERQLENKFSARWEAGSKDRTIQEKWLTSRLSPDSCLEQDLEEARERSTDLYQNDAVCASAIDGMTANTVGCGLAPQARVREERGVITRDQARRINDQLEDVYRRWAYAVNFPLWQQQIQRLKLIHGDVFVHLADVGRTDKPIPLECEVIDGPRVETPPGQAPFELVRLGVERNEAGQVVAYYVRRAEPGDTKRISFEYDRIEAFEAGDRMRPRMLHYFRQVYPRQSRGMPWIAPILRLLKAQHDYVEAETIAKQVEACLALFVETSAPPNLIAEGASAETDADGRRIEDLAPGRILYGTAGDKPHLLDPNRPGNSFDSFMTWNNRLIAAGLSYPYELLVKRYENSYAGGRLAIIDGRHNFRCEQQLLMGLVLSPIWRRIVREAVILGEVDIDASTYEAMPHLFERHAWIPPTMEWIDPTAEVKAAIDSLGANLDTLANIAAARGLDWEELVEQRAVEMELLREKGLLGAAAATSVASDAPQADDESDDGAEDASDETAEAYA